jgi:hypothetical protein
MGGEVVVFVARCLQIALLLVPALAHADFYERPFELRLFFTVDRQSNYASTLARQASIAALESASANPGAAAWRVPASSQASLTASFVDGIASGGRQFVAAPVSLRWQAPDHGTIALAYAHTDTLNGEGGEDLTRSLRSDEWMGGYGRRLDERSAIGFTTRVTSGTIANDQPGRNDRVALRNATRFLAREIQIGYAVQIDPRTSAGIVGGYGLTTARTAVTNRAPLFVPLPNGVARFALPADSLLAISRDTIRMFAIGAGAGFAFGETNLYADARALRLSTHQSGDQNLVRFSVGSDHHFDGGWNGLAGVSVDTAGNANWSAGIAYRPEPTIEAQFTFQSNAAPELNPELGKTRLLGASLAWRL